MIGRTFGLGLPMAYSNGGGGQVPDITGVIISNPPPEPGGGSGGTGYGGVTGSGGATPGPTPGTAAAGDGSQGSPSGFGIDLCSKVLGTGPVAQTICQGNLNICSLLCSLAGQTDPDALNTCAQTYCPMTFILGMVAAGWIVYRLVRHQLS